MTYKHILASAAECIKERSELYGGQHDGFTKTAAVWTAILGMPISPKQVVLMFMANKLCRETFAHKEDNLIDIAGYAQVLNDLHVEQDERIRFRRETCSASRETLHKMYEDHSNAIWKRDMILEALRTLDIMQAMNIATVERK